MHSANVADDDAMSDGIRAAIKFVGDKQAAAQIGNVVR